MSLVAADGRAEAEKLLVSIPLTAAGGGDHPKQWKGAERTSCGVQNAVVLVPGENRGGLEWRANRTLLRLSVPNSKPLEKF